MIGRWLSAQKAERMAGDVGYTSEEFLAMAKTGEAPGHISESGVLFFYADELEAWLEEQRPTAAARHAAQRERAKPYRDPRDG